MSETKEKFDIKTLLQADVSTLFKKKSDKTNTKPKKVKKAEHKKDVVVFDIGAKSVHVVVGKQTKDKTIVKKCFSILTPTDTMNDGKIINEMSLANSMQLALNENGVKVRDAVITTNSSLIINREMVINKVEEDEMETVIRYEMQQYLPINLNDYLVRYIILDEFEEHEKLKLKVYVIAYPDRLGKGYFSLLKSADLKPFALETTYISLNKIINQSQSINGVALDETETIAFLDIGAASIDVNIFKNKKIELTRILKLGGDNLDFMLSQRHSIPLQSALSVKNRMNLMSDDESEEVTSIKLAIDNLNFEIDRIFQFYKNKSYSAIDKVYIYGGVAKLQGLDQYMSEKLGISVEAIQSFDRIELTTDQEGQPLSEYINAIGGIIRL